MFFSLIVCTYMRPKALSKLLESILCQSMYPDEILIIDGSLDNNTKGMLNKYNFGGLTYYKVSAENRGLTNQRNYGISLVSKESNIICFLDDDVVLEKDYFKCLISTYIEYPEALAAGGYITNEVKWEIADKEQDKKHFYFDGYMRLEPLRFRIRSFLKLLPDKPPGYLPSFSHGRSVSFLPPSGKIYEVEQIMGGVSSFRKKIFDNMSFSPYFKGYGLYEDTDFSLRLAKRGKLFVNTNAKLSHYHDSSGRPDMFKYGKMVIRNGWYVWRVKYPKPLIKNRIKWYMTAIVLMTIRFTNSFNSDGKGEALTESLGRFYGLVTLFFNKPKLIFK